MKEYHYTECGINNVYLVNGFEFDKNSSEQEIFIHNIHELHKAIGMNLIFKVGLLAGEEIKFIRHTLDCSQITLAHILGVDYQTVLGWEKNKWPISKTADHYLRTIFFSYLKKNTPVYDMINEIANLGANIDAEKAKINKFRVEGHEWHLDKAA